MQRRRRLVLREIGANDANRAGARRSRAPGNSGQAILAPRRQHEIVVLPPERIGELFAKSARRSGD